MMRDEHKVNVEELAKVLASQLSAVYMDLTWPVHEQLPIIWGPDGKGRGQC